MPYTYRSDVHLSDHTTDRARIQNYIDMFNYPISIIDSFWIPTTYGMVYILIWSNNIIITERLNRIVTLNVHFVEYAIGTMTPSFQCNIRIIQDRNFFTLLNENENKFVETLMKEYVKRRNNGGEYGSGR
jgi:hypothetical protein